MGVLDKDKIETLIVPHLSRGERGKGLNVDFSCIIAAILYRLKSGCQWRMLPVSVFFPAGNVLTWEGVYYHFNRWSKDGSFIRLWIELLKANRKQFDLSSIQLDGSLSLAKRGGEQVGYQARKKGKSTNALFLCDNNGMPLAVSEPQSGNHHDVFDIKNSFGELCDLLQEAGIDLKGTFLNADSGFDSETLRAECSSREIEANIDINHRNSSKETDEYLYFDDKLYRRRFVIERMNAWIDAFKILLVRFETKACTWRALHLIAFAVITIRKL